jgi:hypothetical protein
MTSTGAAVLGWARQLSISTTVGTLVKIMDEASIGKSYSECLIYAKGPSPILSPRNQY